MKEEKSFCLSNEAFHDVGVRLRGKPILTVPHPDVVKNIVPIIQAALDRNLPEVVYKKDKEVSVIAFRPNLEDTFFQYDHKGIICVNHAHDWLLDQG